MATSRNNSLDVLNSDFTVIEQCNRIFPRTVSGRCGPQNSSFSGEDVDKKIAHSPAEKKSRLAIARHALQPAELPGGSTNLQSPGSSDKKCWSTP